MPIINSDNLQLQTLKIPLGFSVLWNTFYDVLDKGQEVFFDDFPRQQPHELYRSLLFQTAYSDLNLLIVLGWAPEHDPDGKFILNLFKENDERWDSPLYEFSSRSKDEIVDKLNQLMADVAAGKFRVK